MSLLSQIRPAESEKVDRRWGKRKFEPNSNLCRYLKPPNLQEAKDPKAPLFKLEIEDRGRERLYTSPYGVLIGDVKDQFARHCQWKTSSQSAYVYHNPPHPPPGPRVAPEIHCRADMTRAVWPGRCYPQCYEYQQVPVRKGLLPEGKAWPTIESDYRRFPHHVGPRQDLFREVIHNIAGRTKEEENLTKDYIRTLVKQEALNTQYRKPVVHYDGLQDQVRVNEGLRRPDGRNPMCWTSHYDAHFNRYIPPKEYTNPRYCALKPLSKTRVLQRPFTYFNRVEYPHSLDYLPTPCPLQKDKPTDLRLISSYKL